MDLGGIRKKSYSAKSSYSDASSLHHYSMVSWCTPRAISTRNSRIKSSPSPLVWKGYNWVLYAIEALNNFNHSRSKAYFVILARRAHRTYRLDPAPVAIPEARRLHGSMELLLHSENTNTLIESLNLYFVFPISPPLSTSHVRKWCYN
jgi:hypothetical protein